RPQQAVLPADKDRAHQVAPDEQAEEDVVQLVVAVRVEDGEQDEPDGADDRKRYRKRLEDLLAAGRVGEEAAAVAEPAVGGEREVQEDGGQDAARDEERLELVRANVGDVRDRGVLRHGGVAPLVMVNDPVEEEPEEGPEPDEAGDDGEDLLVAVSGVLVEVRCFILVTEKGTGCAAVAWTNPIGYAERHAAIREPLAKAKVKTYIYI